MRRARPRGPLLARAPLLTRGPSVARAPLLVLATLLILAGASCTAGGAKAGGTAPGPDAAPARLYLAIGASETRGVGTDDPLRQSWPQDLFRTLPANYRLVNLGIPSATVATALTDELPIAETMHPALVTVWLNVNDLLSVVPSSTYQSQLDLLVHRLRATGAAVLVANTPPLDQLPSYLACGDPVAHPGGCPSFVPRPLPSPRQVAAAVDGYNVAIAAVVAQEGAVLVDLHRAGVAARDQGTEASLISADGFHPSAAGAVVIARQFALALPKQP
jgi:acyl-CoA thioesterase-1